MSNIAVQKVQDASGATLPLFQEIDRRMEEVGRRAFELSMARGQADGHEMEDWIRAEHEIMGWPAAELAEMDGVFKLEMTLPGFDPAQIRIAATPAEIAVHAEANRKANGEHVLWTEFGPNDVYRRFRLPQSIDVARTRAEFKNGLLKITAAKMSTV